MQAGEIFNYLTAIHKVDKSHWLFRCRCGKELVAFTRNVVSGHTKSCGCLVKDLKLQQSQQLIGKTYNKLTILSLFTSDDFGGIMCKCSCKCGSVIDVPLAKVKSGNVKSCGCLINKPPNLVGFKFNYLTVEKQLSVNPVRWLCRCACGNTTTLITYQITHKKQKSCGKCNLGKKYGNTTKLIGKKFNKLLVTAFDHYDSAHKAYWKCKCECGNETVVQGHNLQSGAVKSCGCNHKLALFKDITGQKFGLVTTEKFIGVNSHKHTQYLCRCDCGNTFIADRSNLVLGHYFSCGCKVRKQTETDIYNYIKSLTNYNIEQNKHIIKVDDNLRRNLEVDIYIPKLNLGIEYNGSAFHASLNGAYNNKPKNYHRDKFLQAKKQGIHLINIFDVDWQNNQDKIKRYLKDLLTPPIKLYARSCSIQQITKGEAMNFFESYHLQGKTNSSTINYGLFYQGILVSVMGFGNIRYHKKSDEYELYRYCVKSGYTILGGAQKLLKHFEADYSPKILVSYSDNDYFMGKIYEQLGFSYVRQCPPNYFWFYQNQEIKREACQVKKLKIKYPELYEKAQSAKNKEDFIMTELGARKVYRAGNTRWEKES